MHPLMPRTGRGRSFGVRGSASCSFYKLFPRERAQVHADGAAAGGSGPAAAGHASALRAGPRRAVERAVVNPLQARRMVTSSGGSNRRVSRSRMPSASKRCGGASAIHSPIAANDRDPASTAAPPLRLTTRSADDAPRAALAGHGSSPGTQAGQGTRLPETPGHRG